MLDNSTFGHCSPCRGKIISGTEGSPGDGRIRGLIDKEMAIYGLVMYFVKIWVKDPVLDNCKLTPFCIK